MGYILTATTTTLTAKLTPLGRTLLLQNDTNLISTFSFGDSDANYNATLPLTTGEVPTNGGNVGAYSSISNSVPQNVGLNSVLYVDSTGAKTKAVEPQSSAVTLDYISNGFTTVSGSNITINVISRSNINTDPLVNLYSSFNLPVDSNADYTFTGLSSNFGGFAGTALSGLDATNILVLGIPTNSYGELIDGKSIHVYLETIYTNFNIYSTYQNTGLAATVQDANYNDTAANTQFLGGNIALLFSDGIQQPNNFSSLSWATGYNTNKPFSQNGKQLYNLTTNPSLGKNQDIVVGVAYLDKGFIVITHPTIANNFNTASTATVISYNSVSSVVTQNVTCIANRGEFGTSTNPTFKTGDVPRISEVGLYDSAGNLIAMAKTDRHIVKNINDFFALGIKISV